MRVTRARHEHVDTAPARFTHTIASAVRVFLGLLLLGMVALNVANAICRTCSAMVLTGADEVLVFSMIWMVMVGMILATVDRRHIALDFLVTRAGPRQRIALTILHHAVLTGACAYAAFYCWSVRHACRRDRTDQHGARRPDGDPAFRRCSSALPAPRSRPRCCSPPTSRQLARAPRPAR